MTEKKKKKTDKAKQKPETVDPVVDQTGVEPTEEDSATEPSQRSVESAAKEEKKEEPLRDQLLRMKADFDNFRKRQIRERAEWIVRANEDLFLELLPVLDHYEMGLKSAEEHQTDRSVVEGFRLVYNQLLDVLKKSNVIPMDVKGKAFDPHHHEALTHMPSDQAAETVVEEVRRGYLLAEKLLRAAQVVVSSGPPKESVETEKEG